MNTKITARKFKARESLKDFVKNEIENLNKYHDNILDVDVVLSFQNSRDSVKIAEINVHVPGRTFFATQKSDEFEKSVSAAVEKLIKQLKTLKSKRTSRVK
ncbi:MAG: ribosome-associated translation inhibitor RaiA [Ignavibacteria bacterium]|nr:ribosome-associated translation inhibitor RaiA [Ignavibacteria bacterium]MBT8381790.1 ribosome-associated translation inhibitor RaiA [Ignavibacteria bacterium]MBT8392618.1 ribosome-associated translation inhibitor RaiA [Ignavibacteria bacterium]NNJ51623.1 ribosome-associated translation inhibitor RaiA [Ignavibacteriaceae bacterium]NNL20297.1 ribosome-associated translation inhibitor RaiA [Ignavibacteriaceae bacterium]